jgi:dethiobiotin synthetase
LHAFEATHDRVLVEGAGGLLVPLDREHTMADLALALDYPLLLVAPDRLGVLSHVLTAYEAAMTRKLRIAAVVLTQVERDSPDDPSRATNTRILRERLDSPVLQFPHVDDNDDMLAAAAVASGLIAALDV